MTIPTVFDKLFAYPEICRACIKVKHEGLCGSTNLDRAEVLGIVLLIVCCNLASIRGTRPSLLNQNAVGGCLASNFVKKAMVTGLRDLVYVEVWPGFGGLETPLLEEVDVGFGTRSLVLLVRNDFNLLQAVKSSHDEE